jgi:hypothetical protein
MGSWGASGAVAHDRSRVRVRSCRRDRSRGDTVPVGRESRIENRPPNCPSSPEARLILFSGVIRPLGRNGRQRAEDRDTPKGCSVAAALWRPSECACHLAVSTQ